MDDGSSQVQHGVHQATFAVRLRGLLDFIAINHPHGAAPARIDDTNGQIAARLTGSSTTAEP